MGLKKRIIDGDNVTSEWAYSRGAWMSQPVRCLIVATLDFSSGNDLNVVRLSPARILCSAGSLLEILSLLLLLPPSHPPPQINK